MNRLLRRIAAIGGAILGGLVVLTVVLGIVGSQSNGTAKAVPEAGASTSPQAVPSIAVTSAPKSTGKSKPSRHRATTSARSPKAKPTTSSHPRPKVGTALAAAEQLAVKGRAPKTGYSRDQFGTAWKDTDGDGCDQRDDVLNRDLINKKFDGCEVLSGTLRDPYTGRTIHFRRGESTSSAVQIDHVVAESDAWQTGAQKWSAAKRLRFATDTLNLFAVDGPTNESKGDGDTATWLPPNKSFRCNYVAHQVAVKKKYGLWVTPAEGAAMVRVLSGCPSVRVPKRAAIPSHPAPKPEPHNPAADSGSGGGSRTSGRSSSGTRDQGVVHPGAYCSPDGATGVTSKGTPMICKTTATDSRDRWRSR